MASDITEDKFLKDVKDHVMTIIRDDGVYRHIRFKKPGTTNMYFDLVTWPGMLCYCGDMGTYVFSRLEDMFEFFRTDRKYSESRGRKLSINLGYWAEKLQAVDGNRLESGAEEFDHDRFVQVVKEWRIQKIRDYLRGPNYTKEQRRAFWDDVENYLLDGEEDEHSCYQRLRDFSHHVDVGYRDDNILGRKEGPTFEFEDWWDHNFKKWTYRFHWCCFALAWGILQYDEAKKVMKDAEYHAPADQPSREG